MTSLADRERAVFMTTYTRLNVDVDHASGSRVHTSDGRELLVLVAGLAVLALGHSHPAVLTAVSTQMQRYAHVSNVFLQDVQIDFAETLTRLSGADAVFLSNSGTESIEAAVKLIRRFAHSTERSSIISFDGSFHGRSLAALGLMSEPAYRNGFGPWPSTHVHLPFNDVHRLREAADDSTAAIVLEPVQGEGGVRSASRDFIDEINALRDRYGFLVIADEIQTGAGRCGSFLASDVLGLKADAWVMAKAIGGGLPLGALLVGKELRDVFGAGGHGSTFGGNPVACAAGLAVLRTIEQDRLTVNAAQRGAQIRDAMTRLAERLPQAIRDVRGHGLMIGIELSRPAIGVQRRCLDNDLLINVTRGNTIRLLPPLNLTDEDTRIALEVLSAAIVSEFS